MVQIIKTLLLICLYKAAPQDLPHSTRVLRSVILCLLMIYYFGVTMHTNSTQALMITVSQSAIMGFAIWFVLRIYQKSDRWTQVAIAFFGCSAIIHVLSLPLANHLISSGVEANMSSKAMFTIQLLNIWLFVITARIIKEAIESPFFLAVLITLVLKLGSTNLLILLFGGPT